MEIYNLTSMGYKLSHTTRNPMTPQWGVIHYLARQHQASGEKLMREVRGLTPGMLGNLRRKEIIKGDAGVPV